MSEHFKIPRYSEEAIEGAAEEVLHTESANIKSISRRWDVPRSTVFDHVKATGENHDRDILRRVCQNSRRYEYKDKRLFSPLQDYFIDVEVDENAEEIP
jgi:hypothetical protein